MSNNAAIGADGIRWDDHWQYIQLDIQDAKVKDLEWTFDYLPKRQFSILEVGCGPARYCNAWELIGGHYSGLDFSEVAITKAKELHPNNQFIRGFNYEVGIFGRTFDVIFTNTHLQHCFNREKPFLIQQVYKYLNPEGLFINNLEKDDIQTGTTMLKDEWVKLVESHNFKLEAYAGTNKGYVFRRL